MKEPIGAIDFSRPSPKPPAKPAGIMVWFIFFTSLFIVAFCIGAGSGFLYQMYKTLPLPSELSNIQPSLSSKVLAADGSKLHEFSMERRFWVPLEKIPLDLKHAVIAIEDRRFYDHWGVDLKRILRAIIIDLIARDYAQGASTLTQQLARNVYLTSKQSMVRKIREIMTAVQIESYYTKDEIFELYLNMVYFGAGVYGVEAASQKYFSKHVSDLNLHECAVMAGLIQLPEYYRPDKRENLPRTIIRRKSVINAMRVMGYVTKDAAKAILTDTIPVNPQEDISKHAPYFVEMVRQYIENKYGEDLLYNGGLTIHTTLNAAAQDSTDKWLPFYLDSVQRRTNGVFLDGIQAYRDIKVTRIFYQNHFDSLYAINKDKYKTLPDSLKRRTVEGSVLALDVKTGAIRVCTGGRDFNRSKFNRALNAQRQPGSAFKPFVYTVAIDSGFTPATVVSDLPITLETSEGLWRPENFDQEFTGSMTIRDAIKRSINLAAIQVIQEIGIENVVRYVRKAGLMGHFEAVPALAIGSGEATNMELTSAYSVYPNLGVQATPYFIESVYDKNGRLQEKHVHEEKQVLASRTAYLMASLLTSVIRNGTAFAVNTMGFTRPAGGKTGTTNDYSDAWFIGFTPQISCGVWVGVDERRSMGPGITGSLAAVPIWVHSMKALHKNLPVKNFSQPDGIVSATVCKKSYKIANPYCKDFYFEVFDQNHLIDTCDVHGPNGTAAKNNIRTMLGSKKKKSEPEAPAAKKKRKLIF
jgi:penicillin-binding protein 1A